MVHTQNRSASQSWEIEAASDGAQWPKWEMGACQPVHPNPAAHRGAVRMAPGREPTEAGASPEAEAVKDRNGWREG